MNDTVTQTKDPSSSFLLVIIGWMALVVGVFLVVALAMGWLSKVVYLSSIPGGTDGGANAESRLAGASALGLPTPDFRLPSLEGPAISPADYRGKVVVVDFWATWCGPCRLQAKVLEDLKAEVGDTVQFLAVDIGEDEQTVRDYVAKRPFPYPVLLDSSDSLSGPYKIYGLPTVMVINPQGEVVYHQVGVTSLEELRQQVAAAQEQEA